MSPLVGPRPSADDRSGDKWRGNRDQETSDFARPCERRRRHRRRSPGAGSDLSGAAHHASPPSPRCRPCASSAVIFGREGRRGRSLRPRPAMRSLPSWKRRAARRPARVQGHRRTPQRHAALLARRRLSQIVRSGIDPAARMRSSAPASPQAGDEVRHFGDEPDALGYR